MTEPKRPRRDVVVTMTPYSPEEIAAMQGSWVIGPVIRPGANSTDSSEQPRTLTPPSEPSAEATDGDSEATS